MVKTVRDFRILSVEVLFIRSFKYGRVSARIFKLSRKLFSFQGRFFKPNCTTMKLKIFSALVTAVGLSSAQTPPGFTPNVTAHLDVIYGTTAVSTPGMSMTEAR